MSVSQEALRTAPECNGEAQHRQVDAELLCLICTELVDEAKQVDCCGGLFCGKCIDIWMNRATVGSGHGCPQCRANLARANIFSDLKSDRKSAACPRPCPFHERYNCKFVGTRQEIVEHKLQCPCDPEGCSSKRCRMERATLEASIATNKAIFDDTLASEKAKWAALHSQQEQTIQTLKDDKANNAMASATKQALLLAAWTSPEETLKNAVGCDGVKIVPKDSTNKYTVSARKASDQVSLKDVDIVITEANYNVCIFLYRPAHAVAPAGGFPRLKVTVTLISFEPTARADCVDEWVLESDLPVANGFGRPVWLTPAEFGKYFKGGKFALGWTVTFVP